MRVTLSSESEERVLSVSRHFQWRPDETVDVLLKLGEHALNGHQIASDRISELQKRERSS